MKQLEDVKTLMSKWIADLNNSYIRDTFNSIESGKMVRSKLMFLIGDNRDEVVPLASIVELIHMASLLHDDVIDEADTRRGKPSVNATEGTKVSIMMGDILYSKAFVELGKYDQATIEAVAGAVTKLSIGEIEDVNLAKEFNSDENLYMGMIYRKTASLIETACRVSAIATDEDPEIYGEYGKNLGMAFQIIDDLLDIVSTSEELGKPALNDFVEGKTTLPYIYLYEQMGESDREKLKSLHGRVLSKDENSWILDKFKEFGVIKLTFRKAEEFSNRALEVIEDEEMVELQDIVETLMYRSF